MNRYASARLHGCQNFDKWSKITLQLLLWRAPSPYIFCTFGDKWVKKWGPRDIDQAVQTEPAPRGRQACRANGCHTPRTPMNLLSDFRTPRAGEAPQRPIGFGQRTRWGRGPTSSQKCTFWNKNEKRDQSHRGPSFRNSDELPAQN